MHFHAIFSSIKNVLKRTDGVKDMPSCHETLVDLLFEVNQSFARLAKKMSKEHKLSFLTMLVLRQITVEPSITVNEVARRIGTSKSRTSTIVDELYRQGWVKKVPDLEDRRLLHLHLTEEALADWKRMRVSMRSQLAEVISEVPEDKVEEMITGLKLLKETLDQKGIEE